MVKTENTLTVAVVSSRSRFCDVDYNLSHFSGIIDRAVQRGAQLVFFPELSLTGYSCHPDIIKAAERIPGPATEALGKIARVRGVTISVGMAEKAGRNYHIAQILVGPDGYIGKYRKHHLTSTEDRCGFSSGKAIGSFLVDRFRVGINICFDGRHEDTIEAMKRRRAEVILHPHGNYLSHGGDAEAWTYGKMVYLPSRAIRARSYLLINNSAGNMAVPGGCAQFGSGAMVLDPLGQVVKRTLRRDRSEKMILADLRRPLSAIIPEKELKRL